MNLKFRFESCKALCFFLRDSGSQFQCVQNINQKRRALEKFKLNTIIPLKSGSLVIHKKTGAPLMASNVFKRSVSIPLTANQCFKGARKRRLCVHHLAKSSLCLDENQNSARIHWSYDRHTLLFQTMSKVTLRS